MKRDMINDRCSISGRQVEVHLCKCRRWRLRCNFVSYDIFGERRVWARHAGRRRRRVRKKRSKRNAAPWDAPPKRQKRCVVALDIGADNSNLVIPTASGIIWQRPIPVAAILHRALTRKMSLLRQGRAYEAQCHPSLRSEKILRLDPPRLNEFVGEVQRSLGIFHQHASRRQIESMVGLGSAFSAAGPAKF